MNTLLHILVVVAFAIVTLSNSAFGATEEDINKIVAGITAEKRPANELAWKKAESAGEPWYQSVVQLKDRKVTVAYFPTSKSGGVKGWIAFWWRPNKSPKELWNCSVNLQGQSQGGGDPQEKKATIQLLSTGEWRGKEHLPFWQNESDLMIAKLIAFYGGKK